MYTPILKWKAGEKRALQKLPDSIKTQILPLIELQPCNDMAESTAIIRKFGDDIVKYLGSKYAFLLDFSYFDSEMTTDGYIKSFLEVCMSKGLPCTPVISLENYDLLLDQFKEAKNFIKYGIAIRITPKTLLEFNDSIKKIIEEMHLSKSSITLIIDFGHVTENEFPFYVLGFNAIKNSLDLNEYQNTIITATGFPNGFPSSYMNNETMKLFQRTELLLWEKLDVSGINNLHFGDYCCSSPAPLTTDTSVLRPSAIIKYTTKKSWLIVRGEQLFRAGHSQYRELSKKITQSEYFYGENYSYGDKFIYDCGNNEDSKLGNPTTWVQVATNHHITLVVNQSLSL